MKLNKYDINFFAECIKMEMMEANKNLLESHDLACLLDKDNLLVFENFLNETIKFSDELKEKNKARLYIATRMKGLLMQKQKQTENEARQIINDLIQYEKRSANNMMLRRKIDSLLSASKMKIGKYKEIYNEAKKSFFEAYKNKDFSNLKKSLKLYILALRNLISTTIYVKFNKEKIEALEKANKSGPVAVKQVFKKYSNGQLANLIAKQSKATTYTANALLIAAVTAMTYIGYKIGKLAWAAFKKLINMFSPNKKVKPETAKNNLKSVRKLKVLVKQEKNKKRKK